MVEISGCPLRVAFGGGRHRDGGARRDLLTEVALLPVELEVVDVRGNAARGIRRQWEIVATLRMSVTQTRRATGPIEPPLSMAPTPSAPVHSSTSLPWKCLSARRSVGAGKGSAPWSYVTMFEPPRYIEPIPVSQTNTGASTKAVLHSCCMPNMWGWFAAIAATPGPGDPVDYLGDNVALKS